MSDFQADLSKFVEKANGNVEKVIRKVIFDLGTKIVLRSPVGDGDYWQSPPPKGYAGGRFRGNWQYGYGTAPVGDLPDIDPGLGTSTKRIFQGVMNARVEGTHYIVNNLPYAKRIEEGWSKRQAPQGVVGLTVVEFENFVREASGKL